MSKINFSSLFCTATLALLVAALPASAFTGADTFKARCAMCHATDGSGSTAVGQRLKVRDLRSSDVQKQSDAQLTAIITNGQKAMPAFGKNLSGEQIKDVVAYIRSIAAK